MTEEQKTAQSLIELLGYDKAIDHVRWASANAEKQVNQDYWEMVDKEIHKLLYASYDYTLRAHCRICDTPIPEGSGWCSECKPETK